MTHCLIMNTLTRDVTIMTQEARNSTRPDSQTSGLAYVLVLLRAHRRFGISACHGGPVQRHTLDTASEELRLLGGKRACIHAHPGDFRRKPAILNLRTSVHHDFEPIVLGELGRLVVAYAKLHPDHSGPRLESERLLNDAKRELRRAKDVDHVDWLGNVGEFCIDFPAEDFAAGLPWV